MSLSCSGRGGCSHSASASVGFSKQTSRRLSLRPSERGRQWVQCLSGGAGPRPHRQWPLDQRKGPMGPQRLLQVFFGGNGENGHRRLEIERSH